MSWQTDKYKLPDVIEPPGYKCVILRIPDREEYIDAFYDAYDSLCRWLSWEQRGDTSARDAGRLFRNYQPLWVDCEIPENIDEDGNMTIQVNVTTNCNCGGCGCCNDYPVPNLPTGTDPTTVPLDPTDPLGSTPTWDDEAQIPPPGYEDYQSWLDDRCRAANWTVDSFLEVVRNADIAERKLSAGGAIMEVVALIIAALPGPIGDWAGTVVIIKWVTAVSAAILDAAGYLEEANDYLQLAADKVEENKQELICGLYQMTTVEWFTAFFISFFGGYVSPELESAGADPTITNWVRDLVTPLATNLAERAANGFASMSIPEGYVPGLDCSTCGSFVPNLYRVTGSLSNRVVLPYTWSFNGEFYRDDGTGLIVDQDGNEAKDWMQNGSVQFNIATFSAQNYWFTFLNGRTESTVNRVQGQLTSSQDINSIVLDGCFTDQAGFAGWYVRLSVGGTVVVNDVKANTPTGYSSTQKCVNLDQTYPAGTVFDVEITSSPGWAEIILGAYFSDTVWVFD